MRVVVMAFALVSAGCANWPEPELVDTFLTSGGAQVRYARCQIDVVTGDYTFQLQNIRVEEGGRIRTDPKVRFDKPELTELTSLQAKGLLNVLDNSLRKACMDMRGSEPTQAKLAQEFYDQAVGVWFEIALKFDRAITEAEFRAEITSGHAQFEELRSVQQNGYRVAGGGN